MAAKKHKKHIIKSVKSVVEKILKSNFYRNIALAIAVILLFCVGSFIERNYYDCYS